MSIDIRPSVGLLAACVCVRKLDNGSTESLLCASVLQAVGYAIKALTDRQDLTAIVVVGEDETGVEVEAMLKARASGLARAVDQAGLFLTLAAQDIVRDRLANEVRFEDFGIHDGGSESRAERLFAVLHPDLPEPTPPHKKVQGNCPRLHKSFIGRHREIDELQDLILQRTLITITGVPGVGKSCTAIHVARSFDDEYEDGVWWFSVDDKSSFEDLLQSIANARGLIALRGPLTIERVAEALEGKRCIVILDGCESMATEIDALCSEILKRCNSLTLLLASTRPIGLVDEHIYRLEPMTLPRPGDVGEDALIGSEALSLFFERATQSGVRLALDDKNIKLASKICEGVDGLPVAIELVAASLRTSSLQKLANELIKDLVPLSSRSFGLSGRQHSLENALKLSYGTLSAEQGSLLHRLAMFRSEWKLDVALQLWGEEFDQAALRRLHLVLAETSWVSYDPDRDTYRMLHTVRSFCWEKAGKEAKPILARYCVGVAALATKVCSELEGTTALDAEALLSRHYADFVFALEEALGGKGLTECASTLMKSMVHFWLRRNLLDDAERLSNAFIGSGVTGMDEARAMVMLGVVHIRRRKSEAAATVLNASLPIFRSLGNRSAEAATLMNLGVAMVDRQGFDQARQYYADAQAIIRDVGPPTQLVQCLCNAAGVEIRYVLEKAPVGEDRRLCLERAQAYLGEAREMAVAHPVSLQAVWHGLGTAALAAGDLDQAEAHLYRAIAVCSKHGLRHEAGEATEALAQINLAKGLAPSAAKLLGLSMQIRKESGKTRTDSELAHFGKLVSDLHEQLDAERADKLMRYGEKLDLAEILTPTVFNV